MNAPAQRAGGLVGFTIGLTAIPAAANGFGRFAYALLLAPMKHDLSWTALTAGSLNAANALGYLLGASLASRSTTKLSPRTTVLGATAATGAFQLCCAASTSVPLLITLRFLTGVCVALAFVTGAAIMARAATGAGRTEGRMLGSYFAGPGAGIAISAVAITPVIAFAGWRVGWLILGALCLICTGAAALALHGIDTQQLQVPTRQRMWNKAALRPTQIAYLLFGVGYIAYMTFAVAFFDARGLPAEVLTAFWFTIGTVGVVFGLILYPHVQHLRDGRGTSMLIGIATVGSALPLIWPSATGALASAVLFSAFLPATAAVLGQARHHLPAIEWQPAIAGLTVTFGIGQCAGPVLAGALADAAGGLRTGLGIGTMFLLLSALVALAQPAGGE